MEEEDEQWEALDVDDSDLPSLLQPCNRHKRRNPNSSSSTTSSQFRLTPCSVSTQNPQSLLQPDPNPSPTRIPGPAGAVQAAMLQRNFDRKNHDFDPISTQEYVRKAFEDCSDFDYDFDSNAWLCALQFTREVRGITGLRSISKSLLGADKVVAVVKSSKPNGLGGVMVTLKDPTGTIGASIHPKVLGDSKFGKNITVGAVLVLKEVAVFAPSRTSVYLNVTLRNVEKVFCKDCDPPANLIDYSERIEAVKNSSIAEKEMLEIEMEKENLLSSSYTNRNLIQDSAENEPLNFRGSSTARGIKEIIRNVTARDKQPGGGKPQPTNNLLECNDRESSPKSDSSQDKLQETDKVQNKTQPFVSKSVLPEWTDEQLDELFAGDDMEY